MEMIEIEAFVAIAQAGSFTRAAEILQRSQPALSRRIELLEREVGAALFERVQDGVRVTAAGEAFLPFARQILAAASDGAAAVRELETGETGTVSLAIVGTLAGTSLTARLREFRRAHPGIRLRLRTALSSEISALVAQGDATLGLRYFPDPSPSLVSVPLQEERLVVVCATHSQLAERPTIEPSDLAGQPWVAFPTGVRFRRANRSRGCWNNNWSVPGRTTPKSSRSTV
jgi:DNA-binding transcriptional LysR family regulator